MRRRQIIMIMPIILRSVDRKVAARGFTLVELLVVMAILASLMGLLLPVLGHIRREADKTVCASNLHQIAVAAQQYADKHRGVMPWPRPRVGKQTDLADDADARAALAM